MLRVVLLEKKPKGIFSREVFPINIAAVLTVWWSRDRDRELFMPMRMRLNCIEGMPPVGRGLVIGLELG